MKNERKTAIICREYFVPIKSALGLTIVGIALGLTIGTVNGLKHGEKQWKNGVQFGMALKDLEQTVCKIKQNHNREKKDRN